jgi:hypothetical protein
LRQATAHHGILGLSDMITNGNLTTAARNRALKIMGWSALGVGVVAAAVYAGYEIRLRYRIKRRSPYELFGHAGDDATWVDDTEYGVGI